MLPMTQLMDNVNPVTALLMSLGLMMLFGFVSSRFTGKLGLPHVTAYIVTGIIMGPFVLNIVPQGIIEGSSFLSDLALSFIAFATGEHFRMESLKRNGLRVVVITLFEALMASVLVFVVTYFILHINLPFSIVLAALASATAPASTLMTIRQTGAKGDFVATLLQVVALDDVVGLLAYSVAISIAIASLSGSFSARFVVLPILENIASVILGGIIGWGLKKMCQIEHTHDNRLIMAVTAFILFCGICTLIDVSPLLGCMVMSTVYINTGGDDALFSIVSEFSSPILLLFFVRSGLSFDLEALVNPSGAIGSYSLLTIGVIYFLVRIIGKYSGAYLGCTVVNKDPKVTNYLGLALIPQAGVAIGLATLGARSLGGETGEALQTIILASSVLYELIGPTCGKLALYLSGSYIDKK